MSVLKCLFEESCVAHEIEESIDWTPSCIDPPLLLLQSFIQPNKYVENQIQPGVYSICLNQEMHLHLESTRVSTGELSSCNDILPTQKIAKCFFKISAQNVFF